MERDRRVGTRPLRTPPARPGVAAALALLLAACLAAGPGWAADRRTCSVAAIDGPEARLRSGGASVPLAPAQALPEDARISTGPATRVRIACDDKLVVTVGVGTEVSLAALVGAAGPQRDVLLDLVAGIVGLVAPERNWQQLAVRTPVVMASVRSTEWLVEHDGAEGSAVFVRRGGVDVDAGGRRFGLGAGEGLSVSAAGVPAEVKIWGAPRIAKATGALGFDWR